MKSRQNLPFSNSSIIVIRLLKRRMFRLYMAHQWLTIIDCEMAPKLASIVNASVKNYIPVSNLLFVSKVLEKVISNRLTEHLTQNNLMDTVCLSLCTLYLNCFIKSAKRFNFSSVWGLCCRSIDVRYFRYIWHYDSQILVSRLHYMHGISGAFMLGMY